MYNEIRQYVKRGGRKMGVMVAGVNEDNNTVGFGWSLCSGNHGDEFDKEKCIDIAEGRAFYNHKNTYIVDDIPMSIQKELEKFTHRMATYYKDNKFSSFVSDLLYEFLDEDFRSYC
jgi:hypothetical protein